MSKNDRSDALRAVHKPGRHPLGFGRRTDDDAPETAGMTSLGLWFFFLSFHSLIINNYFKLLTTATATRGVTVTETDRDRDGGGTAGGGWCPRTTGATRLGPVPSLPPCGEKLFFGTLII